MWWKLALVYLTVSVSLALIIGASIHRTNPIDEEPIIQRPRHDPKRFANAFVTARRRLFS